MLEASVPFATPRLFHAISCSPAETMPLALMRIIQRMVTTVRVHWDSRVLIAKVTTVLAKKIRVRTKVRAQKSPTVKEDSKPLTL